VQLLSLSKHPTFWWNALGQYRVQQVLQSTLFSDTLIQFLIAVTYSLKTILNIFKTTYCVGEWGWNKRVYIFLISSCVLYMSWKSPSSKEWSHLIPPKMVTKWHSSTQHGLSEQSVDISGPSFMLLYMFAQYNNFGWKVLLSKICMIHPQNDEHCNVFLLCLNLKCWA